MSAPNLPVAIDHSQTALPRESKETRPEFFSIGSLLSGAASSPGWSGSDGFEALIRVSTNQRRALIILGEPKGNPAALRTCHNARRVTSQACFSDLRPNTTPLKVP